MDRPIGRWRGESGAWTDGIWTDENRTDGSRAPDRADGGPTRPSGRPAAGAPPGKQIASDEHEPSTDAHRPTARSGTDVAERTSLAASLFARGSTDARAREEAVFERLRELKRDGRIGELSVRTWPGEVSLTRAGHSEVVDTFRAFEEWAQARDASIRPPFAIRERQSTITRQEDTLLLTPLVCLAVYDEDDVVGVYPCAHGGSVTTIDDCIERLAAGDQRESVEPGRRAEDRGDRSAQRPTGGN
jgi:hypothetical protein